MRNFIIIISIAFPFLLNAEESIVGWGNNKNGNISPIILENKSIVDFDTGPFSTCFITEGGETKCFGCEYPLHDYGQCNTDKIPSNWELQFGGMRTSNKALHTVTSSFAASCGINSDGEVECWGCNPPRQNFQCDISEKAKKSKALIPENPLTGLRTLDASEFHTCVVLEDGSVECWGCESPDDYGQCDSQDSDAIALSTGLKHSCLLTKEHNFICWGSNAHNAIEYPKNNKEIKDLDSAFGYNAAIEKDGDLLIWGNKAPISCLDGKSNDCLDTTKKYKTVSASNDYLCLLDISNNIKCHRTKNKKLQSIKERTIPDVRINQNVKSIVADSGVTAALLNTSEIGHLLDNLPSPRSFKDMFTYLQQRKSELPSEKYIKTEGDFVNHIGMRFKTIPEGSFYKGVCSGFWSCLFTGHDASPYELEHETPIQKVNLNYQYQIGVFEVTIGEFKNFLSDNHNNLNDYEDVLYSSDHYPIANISWYDAKEFVKWLNHTKPETDTATYRLPTESEWEYAARAGTKTVYWQGNSIKGKNVTNCLDCIQTKSPGPMPVGSFPANPWGLHDMLGNVDEWVEDCMSYEGYKNTPTDGSSYEGGICEDRIAKGGSWEYTSEALRIAWRDWYPPDSHTLEQGFRVVRELP